MTKDTFLRSRISLLSFPVVESEIGHSVHERLYEFLIRNLFDGRFNVIIYTRNLHGPIQLIFLLPLLLGYKLVFDPRVIDLGVAVIHLFLVDKLNHLLALVVGGPLALF